MDLDLLGLVLVFFLSPQQFIELKTKEGHYKGCQMNRGIVVHACESSMWESKAGGAGVQVQPGLHSQFFFSSTFFY
jgi:hypothetical protein